MNVSFTGDAFGNSLEPSADGNTLVGRDRFIPVSRTGYTDNGHRLYSDDANCAVTIEACERAHSVSIVQSATGIPFSERV